MTYKLSVVVERDDNGYFAYVPELPGCMSQGTTGDEAIANVREAAELYLEDLDPDERESFVSRELSTQSIEVSIA